MVVRGGFEPPKLSRQIYSLIPLATREPLQNLAADSAFLRPGCQQNILKKSCLNNNLSLEFTAFAKFSKPLVLEGRESYAQTAHATSPETGL